MTDLRKYRASENNATVTILDRFAMFAAMHYEGIPYQTLLDRLAGTKNLVFMTSDLHYWSIFPQSIDPGLLARQRLSPAENQYGRLFEMFDRLNIRHLITNYDCPELKHIRSLRPALHTYVMNLHIDTDIFRDYGRRKKYDVIIYGSLTPSVYPFRRRVGKLLAESRQFKILHVKLKSERYRASICGKGLARKINKSWLGLATVSNFDYLVEKYFEIPACRSVVLGNMNQQGREVFGDNYIHIDDQMSDRQIVEVTRDALADREKLKHLADRMYGVMQSSYTLAENERELFELTVQIAQSS
ncbi:MAG TPA: hypothetical protein VF397_16530 [Pyrinomonadaceae bacterium]